MAFEPTPQQLDAYRRDGFLVVDAADWLENGLLESLIGEVDRIQAWPESRDRWMVYLDVLADGSQRLNRTENFLPFSPLLSRIFGPEELGKGVTRLVGEEVVIFKDKINFKQPGGDGFLPHQDAQAGWGAYGHTFHISVAIAIDQTTELNGALEFAAGRHLEGLLGPEGEQLPDAFVSSAKWIRVDASPGSLILFDSFTPHRSDTNNSNSQRRLIYLTYNVAREGDYRNQYFRDKRSSFPPNILRDANQTYEYKI